MSSRRPPKLAIWLLERLAPAYRREALAGDVLEAFRHGRSRAWLWREVLRTLSLRLGESLDSRALRGYLREYRGVLAFLVLMLGFRSAWADWMYVPSGSMNPTLLEGDRILVDKHVYGLRVPFTRVHLTRGQDPARGDVIVFDSPEDGIALVKRVVGVPGDTIALEGDRLIVDGMPARYAPGDQAALRRLLRATRAQHPKVIEESGVVGVAHDILLLPDRWALATFGPLTVPPGEYFALGDNRDNSKDSRYIGLVPRRNIFGRATRIVISFDPDRYELPRRGRFFEPLD
jgi:signal peptidase I